MLTAMFCNVIENYHAKKKNVPHSSKQVAKKNTLMHINDCNWYNETLIVMLHPVHVVNKYLLSNYLVRVIYFF